MQQRYVAAALVSVITLFGGAIVLAQNSGGLQPLQLQQQTWESCEEMHDTYVARFEASPGFGRSRMARPMMLDQKGVLDLGRNQYSIKSLELVGMLTNDPPLVYVPSWHGERSQPAGFTNRQLTAFEKASLASFRAGKSMASATDEASGTLQCMGALRAKDSCLSCHKRNKPGDLLGAFTYRLTTSGVVSRLSGN